VSIYGRYATIRWMAVDASVFSEPFFDSAVTRLRYGSSQAEHETDVEALIRAEGAGSFAKPSGLIIHTSRCGSTLVMNALKEAENVAALGEAQPFDVGLRFAASSSSYWSDVGRGILSAGAHLFTRSHLARGDTLLVKWGVGALVNLRAMRSVWPDIPCLIIVRNPVEVIFSNVQPPSQWLVQACSLQNFGFLPPRHDFGKMPNVIIPTDLVSACAWILGRGYDSLLANLDPLCTVLDYEQICPQTVAAVAGRFGLSYSESGRLRFESCFRENAKHRNKLFRDDRERKRKAATSAIYDAARQWAEAPYLRLKALSIRSSLPR
jgi:hypothetical protein